MDSGFVMDKPDTGFIVGNALDISFFVMGLPAAGFLIVSTGLPETISQMILPIGTFDLVRGKLWARGMRGLDVTVLPSDDGAGD
jgi:hypothetical protein